MSEGTSLRVPGHHLMFEGAPFADTGERLSSYWVWKTTGPGCAKCSCGAMSPELPSTARRKQWHRAHKAAVLAERVSQNDLTPDSSMA